MLARSLLLCGLAASGAAASASIGAAGPAASTAAPGLYEVSADGTDQPTLLGNPTGYVAGLSPNRRRIVLAPSDPPTGSSQRHVQVASLDGSNAIEIAPQLAADQYEVDGASWSPDGKTIAVQAWNVSTCQPGNTSCAIPEVWLAKSNGSGARKLAAHAVSPAWAPNSRRIAFMGNYVTNQAKGAATIMRVDGKTRRRIGPSELASDAFFGLAWAPTGDFLAYIPGSHCVSRLVGCIKVLPVKGGRALQISPAVATFGWSPRTRQIAFVEPIGAGTPNPGEALSVASADGRQFRHLMTTPAHTFLESVKWSPDGRWIAYLRLSQNAVEIRVIRSTGTGDHHVTTLTRHGAICLYPRLIAWSTDSLRLFYVGFTPCVARSAG